MKIKAVIFSRKRPLQLEACLRSFYANCQDADQIPLAVLVKVDEGYDALYRRVARDYPNVVWLEERDFRTDLNGWVHDADYVLFVVDDCLFYRPFKLMEAAALLEANAMVLGFSLRLGLNIERSYTEDRTLTPPAFENTTGNLLWNWHEADGDWGYPLELSSSLYRVGDLPLGAHYDNPNRLEDVFYSVRSVPARHYLMAFEKSVAYCVPANVVQETHITNRHGDFYTAELMRQTYVNGLRLETWHLPEPHSVHQEIEFATWKPKVSIVVPYFNAGATFANALFSIMAQTYENWELIVVDDGSTEFPGKTLEYLKLHARTRYYRIPNGGPTKATHYGFERAYGDYLLRLDADDLLDKDYLAVMVKALAEHPEAGFAYCDTTYFGTGYKHFNQPDWDFPGLLNQNYISYASLIRREAYEKTGYDLENWGYAEDWQLWIRLGAAGFPGVHVPQALFYYRDGGRGLMSKANMLLYRAYIISRQPELWTAEQVSQAERTLAVAPKGWNKHGPQ